MTDSTVQTAAAAPKAALRRTRKTGTVVSAKMEKTVVVEVTRSVRDPRYGKFQKLSLIHI